ncbi:hypothetical protein PFISCL1PPCAC_17554, partial [Pristionchus fissidentatus]
MRSTLLLLAALLVAAVSARNNMFGGRRSGGFLQFDDVKSSVNVHNSRADKTDVSGSATIEQKLDHFNDADTRTFKQRYFFNTEKSGMKTSRVNILFISGEQEAAFRMISGNAPIAGYAEKFAANLYALEHRYYGQSRPFGDTSIENLKFLSSRQAIEDIAYFIKTLNANSANPADQKWIVVGGSYAGNLAAWARLKHPELIVGAVASSAPLLAQVDFYGYLEIVEKNVKQFEACYNQLSTAIDKIVGLFENTNGRKTLDNKFPVFPKLASYVDLQDNDITTFFGYITDIFEGASQYGQPKSVEGICAEFTNHPANYDPVDALSDLYQAYNKYKDGKVKPINANYSASVEEMSDTTFESDYIDRLWVYQTCTEFGYFQTTDKGTNVFQSIVPVNLYFDYCIDVFGIDTKAVKKAVEDTNAYYGERDYYTGTNVLFSHGSVDPWSYLTKQIGSSQHWSVVTVEIAGGTHCMDIFPAANDEVKRVQTLTRQSMDQWLNGPFTAPNSIKLTDNVGKRPAWFSNFVAPPLTVTQNDPSAVAVRAKRSVSDRVKSRRSKLGRGSGWNVIVGKRDNFLLPPPPLEQSMRPEWPVNIEEGRVDQPWDHFDPNNVNFFQQKFYVNEQYVNVGADGAVSKTAPNFLMIGGEGPESNSWVKNEKLAWMTYAKEVGATVYILEHRYYGESKLNTTSFQYLTSSQMLYDVASFIAIVKRDRGVTGPWITFGGSYPGALAAWSREWFPELILGAVGSSGPVLAKNDFFEYLQVVENVLRAKSTNCAIRVQDAFDQLRQLSHDAAGRATISQKFNVMPPWGNNVNEVVPQIDIQNFFSNIYGPFQDIVQYSDDNTEKGNDYTVRELCQIMENTTTYPNSIDAVRYIQKWNRKDYGNPETDSSPSNDIETLKRMALYIDGHKDADGSVPFSDKDLGS